MTDRKKYSVSAEIAGRTLTLETGALAEQADGAVTVRYGDTMLLATVVGAHEPREGIDFFPLTVDYEERMYAAGRIPGNFFKREGRPTTNAILIARLTDRPLRPLFPKGYRNEIQVIITTFSIDRANDPSSLAIIGASAALAISDLPFGGPIGAVIVGHVDGELVVNPLMADMERSKLDLVVAGTADAVLMVEAGAEELPDDELLEAVITGHNVCKQLVELQNQLVALCGRPKRTFVAPVVDTSLDESLATYLGSRLQEAVNNPNKQAREEATKTLRADVIAHFTADEPDEEIAARTKAVTKSFDGLLKEGVRSAILNSDIRVDGRKPNEIRPISIEVGIIPRAHGTGLFTRGQTQVLTFATLGSPGDEQRLDDDLGSLATTKRYIHHYNFPPFSTGEAKRMGSPRRRDIGHGALAERSLVGVLPSRDEFPYTLRLVSETLSSNGSSSMASVCGSSLALMDAGVPIKRHVSGVAMGLITGSGGKWKVLTDIQGVEDNLGDMDFKVAGTTEGVTGLQMDIKTTGITYEIMRQAFAQAREGRLFIIDKMNQVIDKPRAELSQYAPRIVTVQIPVDKIGALIGPGGKTIRSIIEQTGAQIDVEDDGRVFIATADGEAGARAVAMVNGLTREAKVGEVFTGKVVRIMPFGAFVNLMPGKDGMVHVSELDEGRTENVEDVVKMGDELTVMVIAVEPGTGKVSLSRRAVLTGETAEQRIAAGAGGRAGGGSRDRNGGDRGRDRGFAPRGDRDGPPRGERSDSPARTDGPPRNGGDSPPRTSDDRPRPRRREETSE